MSEDSNDSNEVYFEANDHFVDEDKQHNHNNKDNEFEHKRLVCDKQVSSDVYSKDNNIHKITDSLVIKDKNSIKETIVLNNKSVKSGLIVNTEKSPFEVTILNEDDIEINANDIEMSSKESLSFLVIVVIVIIIDLFIICGTAHWIYNYLGGMDWYLKEKTHFNFHIFFMSLGIFIFGIGMIAHRLFRGLASGALNCLHTTLTMICLILFTIGICAAYTSLNTVKSIHFYSVHSWLGLLAMISFLFQWLSAVIIFIFPRFVYEIQILIIPIHTFFGRLVFTLFCCTAIVGISDKLRITATDLEGLGPIDKTIIIDTNETIPRYIRRDTDTYWEIPKEVFLCNIISITIGFYAIFINYLSTNNNYRRRPLSEEQGIEVKTQKLKIQDI